MYTEFHARECHKGPRYEEPRCMAPYMGWASKYDWQHDAEVKQTVKVAPKSTTPRPNYPDYLLRTFNGVLCETI